MAPHSSAETKPKGDSCIEKSPVGSESAGAAYRRYAEAVNGADWCAAIATFVESDRIELAMINFKSLALLAGASNPQREKYSEHFRALCKAQHLSCQSPRWAEEIAVDLLRGADVATKLADVRSAAETQPSRLYTDVMASLSAADQSAMTKLDPSLAEVQVYEDKANGVTKQSDGRTSRMKFAKTDNGWMLTVR